MKRSLLFSVLIFLGAVMFNQAVFAKDLTNRLGLGVKESSALSLPALLMIYHPNPDYSFTAALGIDTEKDNSQFIFNGGIRRIVFREDNMNFYMGGNVGLVNQETNGTKESGFELNGVFGGEFFLAGLDSLAFMFEGGIGVLSLDSTRFRTIGDTPFQAGVVFYF